jgi:hypothetical protein
MVVQIDRQLQARAPELGGAEKRRLAHAVSPNLPVTRIKIAPALGSGSTAARP